MRADGEGRGEDQDSKRAQGLILFFVFQEGKKRVEVEVKGGREEMRKLVSFSCFFPPSLKKSKRKTKTKGKIIKMYLDPHEPLGPFPNLFHHDENQ